MQCQLLLRKSLAGAGALLAAAVMVEVVDKPPKCIHGSNGQ